MSGAPEDSTMSSLENRRNVGVAIAANEKLPDEARAALIAREAEHGR